MFPSKNYKIIRDQVLGYIRLTDAELKVVDTPHFQRLRDVRQLTCQHVYPSALHTRFDHSLGTMELTRTAIEHLDEHIHIPDDLKSATVIAALLHDIGQPPFSHLGEGHVNMRHTAEALLAELGRRGIEDEELARHIPSHKSPHELISCVIFLRHYMENVDVEKSITAFIARCILGLKYQNDKLKNLLISLINSRYFDMDKLDYIMRDTFHTSVGVPPIDLPRLFENIIPAEIDSGLAVAFRSKAVPVLQNIIDARDMLRMRVYNHHAAVYSKFLYGYIFKEMPATFGGMFSLEAVADKFYADSDIFVALNSLRGESPLVRDLFARKFLKPWWKTLYEYEEFMAAKFPNESLRKAVEAAICAEGANGENIRASIVKKVISATGLQQGDFFLAHASNMFFEKDAIKNFHVYLKGSDKFVELTRLLPIKDYDGWYGKNSFYVYMRPAPNPADDAFRREIEDIFVKTAISQI